MEGFSRSQGFICMPAMSRAIIVYWRPGCPFCARLFKALDRAGVEVEAVNIWEDQAGAAIVRSLTGGNETVPTVTVGTTSLVNPSVRQIVSEIRHACDGTLLSPSQDIDDSSSRLAIRQRIGFLYVLLIVIASFTAEAMHRAALSLLIDVVGVVVYVLVRRLRWRRRSSTS
jgi:mycoredoxin